MGWPPNWDALISGAGCPMCGEERPERDAYGVRIHSGQFTDSYLQRSGAQRGYTLVIWRGGRHITEPTELSDAEAASYWADVLTVARALIAHYGPLKMNYETLGNTVPHLHTHLIPRFVADPNPGGPFPFAAAHARALPVPDEQLEAEVAALRERLSTGT